MANTVGTAQGHAAACHRLCAGQDRVLESVVRVERGEAGDSNWLCKKVGNEHETRACQRNVRQAINKVDRYLHIYIYLQYVCSTWRITFYKH